MSKYKTIVFDIDGTLLNTDLYICLAFLNLFQKYRKEYMPSLKELLSFSGPTLEDTFEKYFPNVDKKILFDEYERFSKENLKKYTTLYPDEISVLDELKKRYHLAICTSRRKDAAIACLKYFDLLKYFELIISVDDVSKPKPYPESLLKILGFFQNDNDIKIEVENDKVLTYKVFSVYVTDANDNYIKTNFYNKSEYKEFLDKIKNKSIYKSDINVDENDKIITLSTCSYEFNDARMVVHGKLLK